jgi:flagellar biosynthetic protein FlhB
MAADDKTEDPTGKRVAEARDKGQVAKSEELHAALALLIGGMLLAGPGAMLFQKMSQMLVDALTHVPNDVWLLNLIVTDLILIVPYAGLIIIGLMLTGIVVTVVQTGFLWAKEKVKPDFNRVNPITGLKRLFSPNGMVEILRGLFKLSIVGWVAYDFLRIHIMDLLGLGQMELFSALSFWVGLIFSLISRVAMTYMILAVADYGYQRWQNKKSLKMTKEEIKEEAKQTEGNPQIKAAIRNKQRRLAMMRMMRRVPKADVIITNPTHLAVAIQYKPDEMGAPLVLAKGAYRVAERIVEIAKENKVPIVQNIPLARAIYNNVDIDQEIPQELYFAMAEVLAYVYRLKDKVL